MSSNGGRSWVVDHPKCDDEPAFSDNGLGFQLLEFHIHGNIKIVLITVLYIPHSALFSTLQLYGKYGTLFLFDPPTQNTL